jgi:hypothetical protein
VANKLHLNKNKSVELIFTLKNTNNFASITFTKFLGIFIDCGLTWHKHSDSLADKLTKNVFLALNQNAVDFFANLQTSYLQSVQHEVCSSQD